jgi:hypothetical protein
MMGELSCARTPGSEQSFLGAAGGDEPNDEESTQKTRQQTTLGIRDTDVQRGCLLDIVDFVLDACSSCWTAPRQRIQVGLEANFSRPARLGAGFASFTETNLGRSEALEDTKTFEQGLQVESTEEFRWVEARMISSS